MFSIPPRYVALFIALTSTLALCGAYIAQYIFHLQPCELCLIQRAPFFINIVIGLTALAYARLRLPLIGVAGVVFLVNSAIAFFHSGVERKWWEGLTGCSTPDMSGSIEEVIERIKQTAVVRCDEIPASLFGLSMANYNVMFCLGLGVICLAYAWRSGRNTQ